LLALAPTGFGPQLPSQVEPGKEVWIGINPAGAATVEVDVSVVVVSVVETVVKVVV
jgi:hypothetical protein